jgi:hypothetical protein
MARKKRGLQKSVSSIFSGVALQDVIHQGLSRDLSQQEKTPQKESATTTLAPTGLQGQDRGLLAEADPAQIEPQEQTPMDSVPLVEVPGSADDLMAAPAAPADLSHDARTKQLMASIPCRKHFTCVQSELANLCKAQLGRKGRVVQCLEGKKHACSFRLSFLFKKICRCPIRQYIAKRWGK